MQHSTASQGRITFYTRYSFLEQIWGQRPLLADISPGPSTSRQVWIKLKVDKLTFSLRLATISWHQLAAFG